MVNRIEITEIIIPQHEERGIEITPTLILITFIVLFITFLLGIFYGNFRTKQKKKQTNSPASKTPDNDE